MSQSNLEVALAGYEALNGQDLQSWLMTLDENVELHELAGVPDADIYRGHDAVRGWFEAGREVVDDFGFEIEETRDLGETILTRVRAHGTGRGGGVPFEQRVYHVLNFRNGVVWRLRGFVDEAEAFKAAGLRE